VGRGSVEYYRNPTAIGGVVASHFCTDFSSNAQLNATISKWDAGSPMTWASDSGNEWWQMYFIPGSSIAIEEGRFFLPQNSSFGISVTPPVGNTSMKISINIALYKFDKELL
jgi:hypothetical protein